MRACIIAYTFYDRDFRVRRYAEALATRGDIVDVISLQEDDHTIYEKINDVNIYRVQKRTINEKRKTSYLIKLILFFINSAIFLTKKQIRVRYDLIHVHNVPDFLVFTALLPKLQGAKIILDVHDIVPEFYAEKFNASRKSLLYKLLLLTERASVAFSDHVIISNHIWEKKLISRAVKKERCTTIINYPNTDTFYRGSERKKNTKFTIVYPGSLSWHQGVDIAIRAMDILKDTAPETELKIYGEGPAKNSLKELVSQLGLEKRVHFEKVVTNEKIAQVMANADLGVVPKRSTSFGNEAFSTKVMEFMALGVPVIVAKTKIDSFYFDESMLKFFEPENEKDLAKNILLLIKNAKLRSRLTTRSLKYIEENNWAAKKKIYFDIVDLLTGNDTTLKLSEQNISPRRTTS